MSRICVSMAVFARTVASVPLLFLIFALSVPAPTAVAQQTGFDSNPLQPPITSSPRDTLRSFLDNFTPAADAWRAGNLTPATYRSFERAVDTLDFSSTPNGDAWSVRLVRAIMLKEVLDRIELPPDDQIPGVEEVADEDIIRWTIPDTRLTLRRIVEGPQAGEFRFSADTVERIDKFYRQVKDLPYLRGSTPGLLAEYLASDRTYLAAAERMQNRLKPIDTSSPRWLLQGFLESVNRAHTLILEAEAALNADPPTMTGAQALEAEARAIMFLRRAAGGLDLSKVPRARRDFVGIESVLQIKEILDRMPLPPLSGVPSERTVAAAREGSRQPFVGNDLPLRWKIPNTELEIGEVAEGDRNGEFLFTTRTIRNLSQSFADVKALPYRPELYSFTAKDDYISPAKSENFHEMFTSTPGYLVPSAHFLGSFVNALPESFKTVYDDQTVWQWIGLALSVLAVAVASYAAYRVLKLLRGRLREPWQDWVMVLAPITVAFIVKAGEQFIDQDLNITGQLSFTIVAASQLVIFGLAGLTVYLICVAIAETMIFTPKIPDESIDASLLRIAGRTVGVLIALWIFIDRIDDLGMDVLPLVASLGVGGLAVALAAQTTVANFIGTAILYTIRPVRVGDLFCYDDQMGVVEEIGLHSTRVRTFERSVVTIPNAEFAQLRLDNLALRDERMMRFTLALRYETTPDQMRYILAKLRELLLGHPMVTPEPARVRFRGYGDYSKDVEVFAYLRCQDQSTFLAMQEDILLRMEDIVLGAGSGFAFPSQTAYLARDGGLDADRKSAALAEVEDWRGKNRLPFPEFEEAEREQLADILDYPPKGSPDYGSDVGISDKSREQEAESEEDVERYETSHKQV